MNIKTKPMVTIITPTYKRKLSIVQRSIDCVRAQTFQDWRHVICSDGIWEDEVNKLVQKEADPRRGYCRTEKRHGDYGSCVRQEVMANDWYYDSKYVCFFDDDNIILPTYLEKMVEALESTENDEQFAICPIMHFGPLPRCWGEPPILLHGEPKLYHIDTLQVMVTAEAIKDIGWKDEGYCSDGHTFEALGEKYAHVKVTECLGVHL